MKILIIIVSMLAGISTAGAQTLELKTPLAAPATKAPQWQQNFKDGLSLNTAPNPANDTRQVKTADKELTTITLADNMPIAKPFNTDTGMPVLKTDITAYNMPIVGADNKAKAHVADGTIVIRPDGAIVIEKGDK